MLENQKTALKFHARLHWHCWRSCYYEKSAEVPAQELNLISTTYFQITQTRKSPCPSPFSKIFFSGKCYPKFVSRKALVSASRISIPVFTMASAQSDGIRKALLEFHWTFRSRFFKDLFSKDSKIPKFERFHLISLISLDCNLIFKRTSCKCPVYVPSSQTEHSCICMNVYSICCGSSMW